MPKKKKTAPAQKDAKNKSPARPTRCGPDFLWVTRPPLVEAAALNDVAKVHRLVAAGEDPNAALHFAVGRGKMRVVDVLVAAGADPHTQIQTGDYYVLVPPDPNAPAPAASPVGNAAVQRECGGREREKRAVRLEKNLSAGTAVGVNWKSSRGRAPRLSTEEETNVVETQDQKGM